MALGPRLDLRQSQSLVMTPQLRQAIKLLQFSNLEVSAFIEEELERNPLLERDERAETTPERAAPDQVPVANGVADAADHVVSDTLPMAAETPLDMGEHAETYDPGSASDGFGAGRGGSRDFETDDRGIDEMAESPRNLRDHLGEQLRLNFTDPVDRMIGASLMGLLSPAGRLTVRPADIADAMNLSLDRIEAVRARMMQFDPVGMFALDLRECLAAQLAERDRLDPAMARLLDNLELLGRRELRRLMTLCEVDAEDLSDMIGEIRALDPKPGAGWDAGPVQPLIPDVLMRAAPIAPETPPPGARGHVPTAAGLFGPGPFAGQLARPVGSLAGHDRHLPSSRARIAHEPVGPLEWIVELNPTTMPRVLVNHTFYARVAPGVPKQDRGFLTERLHNANWLVKSLHQRAQTILKVASEIVRQQDGFFRHGVAHLRPLILRDIADAVEMHESTVSRVTANKYIATPRGIFELKYFFTTAIAGTGGESHSAEAVRHRIRAMIDAEPAAEILSDDAIVTALKREGVDIARRTVAKYRDALRIPSSVQRKREKAVPA